MHRFSGIGRTVEGTDGIVDFVCHAGNKIAQGRHLLGYDELIACLFEFPVRSCEFDVGSPQVPAESAGLPGMTPTTVAPLRSNPRLP